MKNEECAVKNKLTESIPVDKMGNIASFMLCFPMKLCSNINSEIVHVFHEDFRCQCQKLQILHNNAYQSNTGKKNSFFFKFWQIL